MKPGALAFFRILPPGAAEVGEDVSREDLRAAGAGDWAMTELTADDLTDVLPPTEAEFDIPICLDDQKPARGEPVIHLSMRKTG